jgi:hypothetical protein
MRQDRRAMLQISAAAALLGGGGARGEQAGGTGRPSPTATVVSIEGDKFCLNGAPTFPGRSFEGRSIEGLLFISRMANAIVDDHNPTTRGCWDYADGPWDPERNTNTFIAALADYKAHGLNAVSINLSGGNPRGYSWLQPWQVGGLTPEGGLRPEYRSRLLRVIRAADQAGMVVNLGIFYKEASRRLNGERAVYAAVDMVTDLLVAEQARNVLVEIANEIDLPGKAPPAWEAVQPARCAELVHRVQEGSKGRLQTPAGRLLVSASFALNPAAAASLDGADYILMHGNALFTPEAMRKAIQAVRADPKYRGQPVLVNEDDHYDFDKPLNNFRVAVSERVGWGFFDYRLDREGFEAGFQSLPVDWRINSPRKAQFFNLLKTITSA